MRRISPRLLALAAAASLGVAGCGGGGDDGGSGSTPSAAATGGSITAYDSSFPDYLDPALTYSSDGWAVHFVTYTPLLTYKHITGDEGAVPIPGLAKALPTITDGGKTYTLQLRGGLTYSDGSTVKASDFEHSIKRVLNLESGGSAYYQGIVGADAYLKAGKAKGDISGITSDDATGQITIRLTKPDGEFPYKLTLPFSALVPGDTPFSNQTKSPPPGVGAFKVTKVDGTRAFTMTKNARFPGFDGVPKAKLDEITFTVVKDSRRQAQDIINNKVDFMYSPPDREQLMTIRNTLKDRFKEYTVPSTYYLFLNQRIAPFDKKEVRQAVNYGLNKPALARTFSGLLTPTCQFLPPGIEGYKKVDCPYGDPNAEPDLAKARALIKQAGAEGAKVTVWGNDIPETRAVTVALAAQLKDIGLDARPKIVESSVYYTTIGNEKTKAQAGFVNWFPDYLHPGTFMFLLNGKTIQPTNNQNYGYVDDPVINSTLDRVSQEADIAKSAPEYAKLDKRIVDEAYLAPYGNRKWTLLTSDRLAFDDIVWHTLYQADYSTFALKR